MLFLPSIIAPSDAVAIKVAFFTVMSAVEYMAGEPLPVVL